MNEINYGFFLSRIYFTRDDRLQNIFVYQPTFTTIKYYHTRTEYIITWQSKEVYITKLASLKNGSLLNTKYFDK